MMHLLRPGLAVFAVQLFWLSIVCIGWSLVCALQRCTKNNFIYKWQDLPAAAKFVIATALSFTLFSVFTVIAYILSLPSWCLGVFYICSLTATILYAFRFGATTYTQSFHSAVKTITAIRLWSPVGTLIVLLLIDLFLTFFIGGFMGADGFIHISKIRHLTLDGFTLTDAYYGTVPETRHTIGVLHTLMTVPSVFGINPITSWYASAVFFKLVKTCAIFYLAWRLFYWKRGDIRIKYAATATILPLALYNSYFISYPAFFVAVWIMVFTVALFDVAEHKNLSLLVISSILIACTHPLASIATALLLCLVVAAWLIFERKLFTRRLALGLLATLAILMSTPIFAATLPNQMTDTAKNFSANDMNYFHVGSLRAFSPTRVQYFDTPAALSWSIAILSALGVIGLFVFIKNRRARCVVGAAVLFAPVVLYNPISFTVLSKHLPIWAIARFTVANQLTLFMAFFGLLFLAASLQKLVRPHLSSATIARLLFVTTLIIFVCTQTYGAVDAAQGKNLSIYDQQRTVLTDMSDIEQALPNDKGAVVLAERTWDSFIIPVVAPLHVVAIHESNSTPAADMTHRSACFDLLYASLDPTLMKQAHVKYVLAKQSETIFYDLAARSPNLKPIKQTATRVLYKFDGADVIAANNPACHFHE